ncbi:MAG: hypothetical protein E3J35_06050 [Methanomassiliicoccales archaeon]|nr:MAG: hypothetical protein E3J35_06050 [Methanomassiliicoccales archaeon]
MAKIWYAYLGTYSGKIVSYPQVRCWAYSVLLSSHYAWRYLLPRHTSVHPEKVKSSFGAYLPKDILNLLQDNIDLHFVERQVKNVFHDAGPLSRAFPLLYGDTGRGKMSLKAVPISPELLIMEIKYLQQQETPDIVRDRGVSEKASKLAKYFHSKIRVKEITGEREMARTEFFDRHVMRPALSKLVSGILSKHNGLDFIRFQLDRTEHMLILTHRASWLPPLYDKVERALREKTLVKLTIGHTEQLNYAGNKHRKDAVENLTMNFPNQVEIIELKDSQLSSSRYIVTDDILMKVDKASGESRSRMAVEETYFYRNFVPKQKTWPEIIKFFKSLVGDDAYEEAMEWKR